MWSLESGQRLLTLRCHTDGVTCLQFNDYSIVSGSYDKTVKLWDFTPSHEFLTPGWTDSFFQQRIQLVKDILFTKILQLTLNHSWNCVLGSCHLEWCYNSNLLLERKIKFLVTFPSSSFAFNHWSLRLIYYYVCHFSKHTMQFSMDKPWINNF